MSSLVRLGEKILEQLSMGVFGKSETELQIQETIALREYIVAQNHLVWKEVYLLGVVTDYDVSSFGTIRNRNTGKEFSGSIGSNGYKHINLRVQIDDKTRRICTCSIHRLVAIAFIPNPNNLPQVNHKDGNKLNNCVSNLEWVTASENTTHSFKLGLQSGKKGLESPMHIYTDEQIHQVCKLLQDQSLSKTKISELTGVSRPVVTSIAVGKRWRHISSGYNISYKPKPIRDVADRKKVCQLLDQGYSTATILSLMGWDNIGRNRSFINYYRKRI